MTNTDEKRERDEEKLRAAVRAELDREEPDPVQRMAAGYKENHERREHERQNEREER